MKKLLLTALAVTLLSSNLFGWYEGTVQEVKITASAVTLTLARPGASSIRRDFAGDAETVKQMLAVALTAKSTENTIRVDYVDGKFTTITTK